MNIMALCLKKKVALQNECNEIESQPLSIAQFEAIRCNLSIKIIKLIEICPSIQRN
jgi:hypothetical protein